MKKFLSGFIEFFINSYFIVLLIAILMTAIWSLQDAKISQTDGINTLSSMPLIEWPDAWILGMAILVIGISVIFYAIFIFPKNTPARR
ncbi:MAG: hypothetical protein WC492_03720 [Candidatus Micrarchaeia archaeon]|jgi:phosphotransferase system  glucose/maltose/N-acetylglucosamine-specific IIC component